MSMAKKKIRKWKSLVFFSFFPGIKLELSMGTIQFKIIKFVWSWNWQVKARQLILQTAITILRMANANFQM